MDQIQLAVVVLLTEPERHHVIIPENYIYGLDKLQDQLKTWGVNSKRNHLVFWKRSFLDDTVIPDSQESPNFEMTPQNDFPPPEGIDSACYLARVKRFFKPELFGAAKAFRDIFRPMLPVPYSNIRSNQPVPPTVPLVHESVEDNNDAVPLDRDEANENDSEENENDIVEDNIDADPEEDEHENDIVESNNDADPEEDEHENATKPILIAAQMDAYDVIAMNDLIAGANMDDLAQNSEGNIDEESEVDEQSEKNDPTAKNVSLDATNNGLSESLVETNGTGQENNALDEDATANDSRQSNETNSIIGAEQENACEPSTSNNDPSSSKNKKEVKKTEVIDDDGDEIEITYVEGQVFLPYVKSTPMLPKPNDLLSGNLPYQAILDRNNTEIERHYKVVVGDDFETVKLKKDLVDFLIRLNKERREDRAVDKFFVRGLLIAVFTVLTVKSGENLNPALIDFIKDLFAVRCASNNENFGGLFDNAFKAACVDICQMK